MENHSFDSLSKEMANGSISRGEALKLVGAALLGGAFASLFPATAQARRSSRRRRGRILVFCERGSVFNSSLINCTNSGGLRFSCSSFTGGEVPSSVSRAGIASDVLSQTSMNLEELPSPANGDNVNQSLELYHNRILLLKATSRF